MFSFFQGNSGGAQASWPLDAVVAALKVKYPSAEKLGTDDNHPIDVYGVEDNGVHFAVALLHSAHGSDEIIELGFFARFAGFTADDDQVMRTNSQLNCSFLTFEGADLFLMCGIGVTGVFDAGHFQLILEAWRRDLAMVLHMLDSSQASMSSFFPLAKNEKALSYAVNRAPQANGGGADITARFFGGSGTKRVVCGACNGRGKRGLIVARHCTVCDGTGLVAG